MLVLVKLWPIFHSHIYLPLDGDSYFRGGYITQTYGSRDTGGPFDAVQMEMPYEMRVDAGQEGRERF